MDPSNQDFFVVSQSSDVLRPLELGWTDEAWRRACLITGSNIRGSAINWGDFIIASSSCLRHKKPSANLWAHYFPHNPLEEEQSRLSHFGPIDDRYGLGIYVSQYQPPLDKDGVDMVDRIPAMDTALLLVNPVKGMFEVRVKTRLQAPLDGLSNEFRVTSPNLNTGMPGSILYSRDGKMAGVVAGFTPRGNMVAFHPMVLEYLHHEAIESTEPVSEVS